MHQPALVRNPSKLAYVADPKARIPPQRADRTWLTISGLAVSAGWSPFSTGNKLCGIFNNFAPGAYPFDLKRLQYGFANYVKRLTSMGHSNTFNSPLEFFQMLANYRKVRRIVVAAYHANHPAQRLTLALMSEVHPMNNLQ